MTKYLAQTLLILISFFFQSAAFAVPTNDDCSTASQLTPNTTCVTTIGDLYLATNENLVSSSCGTTNDVWYYFTVPSGALTTTITINMDNGNTATNSNTYLEVFNANSCAGISTLTSNGCAGVASSFSSNLTPGTKYYFRVFTTAGTGGNSGKYGFTVCVSYTLAPTPPSNDDCASATTLTVGAASTAGTVWLATASSGAPSGCAGDPDDDVWYKFVATSTNTSITLSSIGTNLSSSGTMTQLFSGACGSLSSLACAGTSTLYVTGLTVGNTYYVRVYSYGTGSIGGTSSGSSFNIAATVPSSLTSNSGKNSRMNEVFQQTVISPANGLSDPWEVIYGPDGYLWITEAKGYKVYRMDPATGSKVTVLDISQNSTFLPSSDQTFNVQFSSSQNPWPQGGFAGMVLHPKFLDAVSPKNYVYVSYVHTYISGTGASTSGVFFTNRVVRFNYNTSTGKLESPVSLCDTLPGSSDHNSQRMIIAPVGGTYYLFYAEGDMGAGQFTNLTRVNKAQNSASYEGKILRFNLEDDGDGGTLDKWIPNDNPFNNGSIQSAVWSTGIRNNQGFGYAKINGTDYIYGSSHGPYSDDEVNIIQRAKNYGHPIVIGYSADGNYNNAAAGPSNGSLPLITSEAANATAIGVDYQDPIQTFYSASQSTIYNIWSTNPSNSTWPSEAPSGMEVYTNSMIPGWKNSILQGMLKGGKVMRLKLNSNGDGIQPTAGADTVSYFYSVNRFRDVAIAPDGRTIFTVIDKSSTTSGPTTTNPMVSACAGCVIKYTFLGYNTVNSRSDIPTSIDVTTGTNNSCTTANTITIDNTNNNLWVPITGTDGNVLAEINANGNNLGTVTSSFYTNSGSVREDASNKLYANRNITITPQNQPSSSVSIRLYLTAAEFNSLKTATNSFGNASGVNLIGDVSILKNTDACGPTKTNAVTIITPVYAEAFGNNYVLQGSISSFSSFYFGNPSMTVLPLTLLDFRGKMQQNSALLNWETSNEAHTSHFVVERSIDGNNYVSLGKVATAGNGNNAYSYTDTEAGYQPTNSLYYRLKMVDIDGKYTYSKIVTLGLTKNKQILVFPNPVKQTLKIRLSDNAEPLTIQIADLAGRTVYTEKTFTTSIDIEVKHWKPQVYIVRVINNKNEVINYQKFEKL